MGARVTSTYGVCEHDWCMVLIVDSVGIAKDDGGMLNRKDLFRWYCTKCRIHDYEMAQRG